MARIAPSGHSRGDARRIGTLTDSVSETRGPARFAASRRRPTNPARGLRRSAHSSPRRAPVVMASHKNAPHHASPRAAFRIVASCAPRCTRGCRRRRAGRLDGRRSGLGTGGGPPGGCRASRRRGSPRWRSVSRMTVAVMRGLRCSSTWSTDRLRIFSASAPVSGRPAGTVSTRSFRLPLGASMPAYTLTRNDLLGKAWIRRRCRCRAPRGHATGSRHGAGVATTRFTASSMSAGRRIVVAPLTCVPPAGFEPAAPALGERCSIP